MVCSLMELIVLARSHPGSWCTREGVLPIGACSGEIVPGLGRAGYEVCYRGFERGHAIPPEIALEAVYWFRRS